VSVYSTLFYLGTLPTAQGTLYTVPALQTVVVRDIELTNPGVGTPLTYVSAHVSGLDAVIMWLNAFPNDTSQQWQGRVVLPAGSLIRGYCAVANVQCIVSGYLLS
jgi:hypothetical protein